jgi:Tol biopolymer transport system component
MELIVADMNFSNKKTLALGTSIIGTTWSMDNSRLVFSVTKEEVGEMGTYVSDLKEDTITRIASFVDVIGMSWSPSGKKIAVYRIDLENEKNDIWTSVITLSK